MVKAKHGMKNKNQAIGFMIQTYAKHFLPDSLQPIEKPGRYSEKKVSNLEEMKKDLRE